MKIQSSDWDVDLNEFHIFPMLCVVRKKPHISIQVGWLFWIYDFTFVL